MNSKYNGTACKTCRKRGRKCTKELPKCHSCLKKGIICEGYALRWAGLASRGRLAGKITLDESVQPPKPVPQQTPQILTNESPLPSWNNQDEEVQQIQSAFSDETLDERTVDGSASTLSPSQFVEAADFEFDLDFNLSQDYMPGHADFMLEQDDISPTDSDLILYNNPMDPYNVPVELKFILNYHILEVAPKLCVDNGSLRNPYSQYILPLAVQKPPLLYACAALAACHFSVRLSDQKFLVDALRFRGKAMRRLQEYLWSEQSAKDEGNLAAVLMLTLTDMCLGGFSNFDAHFKAAKKLIDLRGTNRTQDAFVEQYIAWLDIMSAASNQRKPLFSSSDVMALTGPTKEWSHDVFPCPPDQFSVISDVVELYKSQTDPENPSPETLLQAEKYKSELLILPMHTERGSFWLHLTEAYRHAIVLYIIRLFRFDADEDEVAWLTQSVFYHAKSTPPSTGWADQLLWPLFHAGLEIRDYRRQNWLRERSQVMQRSGGFRNVETAMTILERVWASDTLPDYMTLLAENSSANTIVV